MLLKNDQKYELTTDDYKAMATVIGCGVKTNNGKPEFIDFPKGGVYILPPKPGVYVDAEGKQKLSKPPFYFIPYEQNLETTDDGTVKWNYTVRPPSFRPGETPKYEGDNEKMFQHRFAVQKNQPDLLFFLCCISRCGAHVEGSNLVSYQIENKKRDAVEGISKRREKALVDSYLLVPTTELHPDDIARIAMAMKVENVGDLSPDEIKNALLEKVEAMEASTLHNGYSTFLMYVDKNSPVGSRIDLIAGLQLLKDHKKIKYMGQSHRWFTLDDKGQKTGEIGALVAGKTPDESLEYHAITDPEKGEALSRMIQDCMKLTPASA